MEGFSDYKHKHNKIDCFCVFFIENTKRTNKQTNYV